MGVVRRKTDLFFLFHVTNKIYISIQGSRIVTDFSEVFVRIFEITCHYLSLSLE